MGVERQGPRRPFPSQVYDALRPADVEGHGDKTLDVVTWWAKAAGLWNLFLPPSEHFQGSPTVAQLSGIIPFTEIFRRK